MTDEKQFRVLGREQLFGQPMTSPDIERVARAIAGYYGDYFEKCPKEKGSWKRADAPGHWDCNTPTQDDHMTAARAATRAVLEGLMEPGEGMLRAGVMPSLVNCSGVILAENSAKLVLLRGWQAMLKHKLAELEKEG